MPYLVGFEINDHPKIKPLKLEMDFKESEFLHLIVTGRNGTGKSTLLEALWKRLLPPGNDLRWVLPNRDVIMNFVHAFLRDQHKLTYNEQPGRVPEKLEPNIFQENKERASQQFVPYLKHQHLQMLLSKAAGENDLSSEIEKRLNQLTEALSSLLEIDGLKMHFDPKTYVLSFVEPSGASYNFSQLSAGFAAVLDMVGELMMRIGTRDISNTPGLVLIDEIDAHLHPRMQEKILPFLTHMFPRIQFVVATHSPAVVGSIPNAIVFDLDRLQAESSEAYQGIPYGRVMTSHFGLQTDVGDETTQSLREAEILIDKESLSPEEEAHLWKLLTALRKTQHPLIMQAYSRQLEKRASGKDHIDDRG